MLGHWYIYLDRNFTYCLLEGFLRSLEGELVLKFLAISLVLEDRETRMVNWQIASHQLSPSIIL